MGVPDLAVTILEDYIAVGQLFVVVLVNLLLTVLIAVVQMIVLVVFKIRMIGAVSAGITARFPARIHHIGIFLIRIVRPHVIRHKQEWRHIFIVIVPVIAKSFHRLEHALYHDISGKFQRISRTADSGKGFVGRLIDPLHRRADIKHFRPVDQLLHIRPCQSPVAVDRFIPRRRIYIIVTAASHRADPLQIVKIFQHGHQPCNSALHRRLIDDARFGYAVLRPGRSVVRHHNGDRPSGGLRLIRPLPCQITLYLTVHTLSLSDHRIGRVICQKAVPGFRCLFLRLLLDHFLHLRRRQLKLVFLSTAKKSQRHTNDCNSRKHCLLLQHLFLPLFLFRVSPFPWFSSLSAFLL